VRNITLFIALKNIKRKPKRTLCLAAVTALLAFAVAGGTLLAVSMRNGADSISARLGADAMFVPLGYEPSAEGILLRGEPSTFYLDGGVARRLAAEDGVKRASPQIYIATFNSSHCAFPAQVIGYDPATDFVIAPWLTRKGISPKTGVNGEPDEVVVGSEIYRKTGDTMLIFGRDYRVAAKLDKTGMGFDTSVFMNMETVKNALKDYRSMPEAAETDVKDDAVSAVTVDLRDGTDSAKFAHAIREKYRTERVGVIVTKAMISGFAGQLNFITGVIAVLIVILFAVAAGVLYVLFTVTVNERRREYMIIRAVGATRKKLAGIILAESAVVSLSGAVTGIALLIFLIFPFGRLISKSFADMPYLQPSAAAIAAVLAVSAAVAFLTGPLASVKAAVTIGKSSPHLTVDGDR